MVSYKKSNSKSKKSRNRPISYQQFTDSSVIEKVLSHKQNDSKSKNVLEFTIKWENDDEPTIEKWNENYTLKRNEIVIQYLYDNGLKNFIPKTVDDSKIKKKNDTKKSKNEIKSTTKSQAKLTKIQIPKEKEPKIYIIDDSKTKVNKNKVRNELKNKRSKTNDNSIKKSVKKTVKISSTKIDNKSIKKSVKKIVKTSPSTTSKLLAVKKNVKNSVVGKNQSKIKVKSNDKIKGKVASKAKGKTKGKGKNQKKVTKREIIKLSHRYKNNWEGNSDSDGSVDSAVMDEDICFYCGKDTADLPEDQWGNLISCDVCD